MHLPYLDEGLERVLQPWEERSLELVSWFEMLSFSADAFYGFGRALRDIRTDCYIGSAACLESEPVFAMIRPLDQKARDKAISSFEYVAKHSRHLGMKITAETAEEVIELLKHDSPRNFQWLIDQTSGIEGLARKELRHKAFFYIPEERMRFWPKEKEPFAFGRAVADKFPSTTFDANNAAWAIATTLSTAAVFHLMRIMEIGLSVVGTKFGVSLDHTNWHPAIEQIEKKIRDIPKDGAWRLLPDYKEQQEFYAQAASHLAITKDAWRNYTMHARGKYTQDEAERMFENVRAFMEKLSERLEE